MSAFYFLPREKDRQGQIILNILLFHLLMGGLGALVLVLFPQLLTTIFHSAELVNFAPIIGAVIFFWVVSSYLEVVSVAHQEARLSTVFIICAQLTKTGLLVLAAIVFGSVRALDLRRAGPGDCADNHPAALSALAFSTLLGKFRLGRTADAVVLRFAVWCCRTAFHLTNGPAELFCL